MQQETCRVYQPGMSIDVYLALRNPQTGRDRERFTKDYSHAHWMHFGNGDSEEFQRMQSMTSRAALAMRARALGAA